MRVRDLFRFDDGRTVLCGEVEDGGVVLIRPGPCDVLVDGERVATVAIHPEMILCRPTIPERDGLRSIATRDETSLSREIVRDRTCHVEGPMRYRGHRHLIGIESPPRKYVPDTITYGPALPEGWDGDAWIQPGGGGYFLRAWNKAEARFAIGTGTGYAAAREQLLSEIARGGRTVQIPVTSNG